MAACRCGEEHAVRNVAMQGLGSKDPLNLRDGTRKVERFRRSILRGGSQIYICLWISDKIRIKFLLLCYGSSTEFRMAV